MYVTVVIVSCEVPDVSSTFSIPFDSSDRCPETARSSSPSSPKALRGCVMLSSPCSLLLSNQVHPSLAKNYQQSMNLPRVNQSSSSSNLCFCISVCLARLSYSCNHSELPTTTGTPLSATISFLPSRSAFFMGPSPQTPGLAALDFRTFGLLHWLLRLKGIDTVAFVGRKEGERDRRECREPLKE
jgi:hypothetical protein